MNAFLHVCLRSGALYVFMHFIVYTGVCVLVYVRVYLEIKLLEFIISKSKKILFLQIHLQKSHFEIIVKISGSLSTYVFLFKVPKMKII